MTDTIYGVLLDARGIQQYIFSTNKLKLALGASKIVKNIFGDLLLETLKSINLYEEGMELKWKKFPDTFAILEEETKSEIGYIGGGNALLFFKNEANAKNFVKNWTTKMLFYAPGLVTSTVYERINVTKNKNIDLNILLDNLHKKLVDEKNTFIANTTLHKYGFTEDCSYTGESAEAEIKTPDNVKEYISSVAKAKFNASDTKEELIDFYKEYTFPKELDDLGQTSGESHIAVVHIDGNSVGNIFKQLQNLTDFRKVSSKLSEITKQSVKKMYEYLIRNKDYFTKENKFNVKKGTLPIRVIILGGDDITFVTDARLSIPLTEVFLKAFSAGKIDVLDDKKITASAGVAITNSKYPFYRIYELAEQLCSYAKIPAHRNNKQSYLDFLVLYGGFFGDLEDILKKRFYIKSNYILHLGPYILNNPEDARCLCYLKKGIKHFIGNWPRSKVKELRDAIVSNRLETFTKDCKARGLELPEFNSNNLTSKYWYEDNRKHFSPYFDMVELMDIYPTELDSFNKQEA